MTWGSSCPVCGTEYCRWVVGRICEGNSPKPGVGYRVSVALGDFNSGPYYYIEKEYAGWFRKYWRELPGTRAETPQAALEYFRQLTSIQRR